MIDKLIPRYLNKEDDARLVKSVEMTDALNVRVSADTDGDGGVIKNAFGNAAVAFRSGNNWQGLPHALPNGTNKVVGSVSDLKNGVIIFFVYNSNSNHSIYRFTTSQEEIELVYRDSVLSFQADTLVKGDVINNLYNEVLLYFTDGVTAPKKINVSRAIIGGYSSVITNGTSAQKLEFLTLAKKPPLDPPTYEFFTDTSFDNNSIYENNFQFAYQYIYLDGEYSAISKYTDLAVSPNQYLDGFIEDAQRNEYNAIRVYIETSTADVKTIRVLGRRGNEGPWFIVSEISNPALSSPTTLYAEFRNDELYRYISQDEANKIYDAVPLTAQSQAISGSRLFLGNYTEGYPNVDVQVRLYPNYSDTDSVYNIPVSINTSNVSFPPGTQASVSGFSFDLSSISSVTFAEDALLHIDLSIALNDIVFFAEGAFVQWVELDEDLQQHNAGGLIDNRIKVQVAPMSITSNVIIPAGSNISAVVSAIVSEVQKSYTLKLDSDTTDENYGCYLADTKIIGRGLLYTSKGVRYAASPVPPRWGFFQGSTSLLITSAGLNASNLLNFNIAAMNSASLTLKNVCGGSVTSANVQKQYNIDTSSTIVLSSFTYTKYTDTDIVGEDQDSATVEVDTSTGTVSAPKIVYGYKFVGGFASPGSFTQTYEVLYSSSFVSENIEGYKQFKSGALHELGFVLYDNRGRSTGVQKSGKVYLDWYGSRSYKGKTSIVMRLAGTVPSWAASWAPVYVKSGSIESFIQYSTIKAFAASNVQAINSPSNLANNDYIFVSMRSLEGKDDSYKESQGANLQYTFVEGDKLRVVSYVSSGNKVYPVAVDFDVVGYSNFVDDLDSNPILDRSNDDTIYETTGYFLVLKDKKSAGFDKASIVSGSNNWTEKCIVEIYRNRKSQDEEVYYEIGKSYDVVNGVLSGDRTVVSQVAALCVDDRPLQFRTNVIVYPGDILQDSSGNRFEVQNVYPDVNSTYNYFVDGTLSSGTFTTSSTYTFNIVNSSLVAVEITEGDTYFRPRQLRYGQDVNSYNYFVEYIESDEVSDFFESKNTSIGRPFSVLPDAATLFRTGSVTYSEPFIIDSNRLGLSSFNPSLAPFYDLNYVHGSIRYMVNRDDSIVFLQDKKCGIFPVSRNLIESAQGDSTLTVSTNVVGTPRYYVGEYGVGNNPESVAVENGRIYFADVRNGKVIRLSQDGIEPISEAKMDAFFKDSFRDIVQYASVKQVVAGVDDEAGEYIISSNPIYTSTVNINGDGTDITTAFQLRVVADGGTFEGFGCCDDAITELLGDFSFQLQTDANGSVLFADIEYNDDKLFKFSTEVRDFNDICDTFDNSINAVAYLDRLSAGQAIIVGEEFQGTNDTIYGVSTNSTYDFFVSISINLAAGTFTFVNTCGNYDGSISSPTATASGFTVAYDTDNKVWNTKYSYYPERVASLDDTLYTFKGGAMYIHSDAANRATYYGTAYGSTIEVVSNANASMVKSYESISLEGTDAWAVTLTNTDQSASILSTDFSERERNWYAYIPRDSSANTGTATITTLSGSSEVFVLGNVATGGVSGSTITFTTPVGDVAFPIGGALYKVSGSTLVSLSLTVASISGNKQITASGAVTNVANGDTIVVLANAGIEGDQMRDYYIKARLTNSDTSEIELYAVNLVFAKSNLHNELGQ
jgi:hypothetical protein